MAALASSPAPPLHVQHLEKALRLEPFLNYVEGFLTDPSLAGVSDTEESELSDLEKDFPPKSSEGLNGNCIVNGDLRSCLSPDELRIDKSRLYNFSRVRRDRRWLRDILLSDSSDTSDDDEPLGKDEIKAMLWLHKQKRIACQAYVLDADLGRYQHYGASLVCNAGQDKYYDLQKQLGGKKLKRRKLKDGKMKLVRVKQQEKVKVKKKKKKLDDQDDEQRRLTIEEKILKKSLIRRKEADAKRRKLWQLIVRKEIPRTQRQKSSARNNMLTNAKKLAQMCQKEMRREAVRSQKVALQTAPRARRLSREMMVYWKKYDKVEKEHRKRAEKEAMEQRKLDDELVEARRQQRKLNFLITQTELYAHFMSKKIRGLSTSGQDDTAHEILKKLDEPSTRQNIKSVQGGVLIDMENSDNYDSEVMKNKAISNAHRAFEDQDSRTKEFDANYQQESGKKKVLSQEYCGRSSTTFVDSLKREIEVANTAELAACMTNFDNTFSLANPMLDIKDHPQPTIFRGTLKSYQLKGMNWLFNLYEQGINGILADEMGLGKTVQSIAFLSFLAEEKNKWGPFLIVAPASTLHNWQQEVSRFVPLFKILPYWGNQVDRKSLRKYWNQKQSHINDRDNAPFHVLITSYQLVVQDVRYFQRIRWQYVVLDEAQAIKSSSSVRWKILLGFQCRNRLLLTGTPIQNSMAELWALLHFIMPTLFDNHEEFNEWFSKDIESHAENKSGIDQNQLSRLHMILKPFMLRRIKRDVEDELSEKIEIKVVCGLTTRQQRLYQAVKNKISIDDLVYSTNSSSTASATTSNLMNLVMQFRKVCNHPELFERRDVRSPLYLCLKPFHLPKLVYREGILESVSFSRLKILHSLMNIGTANYIHHSLFGNANAVEKAPPSECFSFLRFINVSPGEASKLMVKSFMLRLVSLLLLLEEAAHLHHRRVWEEEKQKSRHLDRRGLLLWPDSSTSFPNVQSSSALSSIVFTGYTRNTVSHETHRLTPIIVEEESKTSGRRRSSGSTVPTSPTKHQHHHKHRHHKHHAELSSSSAEKHHSTAMNKTNVSGVDRHTSAAKGQQHFSALMHSPTGPFSPPAHHLQSPPGHHREIVSPTDHGPSQEHHPPLVHSPQGHQPLPLHSPTGQLMPGESPMEHSRRQTAGHSPPGVSPGALLSPSRHPVADVTQPSDSMMDGKQTVQPASLISPRKRQKWPLERTLQPTQLPSFLLAYVPKIASVSGLFYCCDRSAAYQVKRTLKGGDALSKHLLLYGTADAQTLEQRKQHLFPSPLGGVEGATPKRGWTSVQIPNRNSLITDSGKLKVLDSLLTQMKAQGHRVLIYSQMTRMIDLLEEYMTFRKHKYMRLDGSSKISDRRDMVQDFQTKSDIFVFLLSTRAGGLGINLTAADTVIFYDSDWNPTVDQQAMDRAHRLGQTKQVTVYRLVTKGSIEERILQRAKEKSEIQRMVISGGHFKPDALKPKEVVSLLLDDEELESKFLMRQAEKKADEQRKRRERKRKKGSTPDDASTPGSVASSDQVTTIPPKAKKGRKSKVAQFVPPIPEASLDSFRGSASEAGSTSGEIIRLENTDADVTAADDISIMSLDEMSTVSGEGSLLSIDAQPSTTATPLSNRPENDDFNLEEPPSGTASPVSTPRDGSKRGRGRVNRGRARGRTGSSTRGRGVGSIRGSRGRGRGRGGSGALAASAAASAAAAAASAAAYAAYGFSFQGSTPTPTPPPSRSSPVAFSAGGTVISGYGAGPGAAGVINQPVAKYDSPLTAGNQSEASNASRPQNSATPSRE